jgi:hypothetical protein
MGVQWKRVHSRSDPEMGTTQLNTARGTAQALCRMVKFIRDRNFFFFNFTDVDNLLVPSHEMPPFSVVRLAR